jgi:hypothetical protein
MSAFCVCAAVPGWCWQMKASEADGFFDEEVQIWD